MNKMYLYALTCASLLSFFACDSDDKKETLEEISIDLGPVFTEGDTVLMLVGSTAEFPTTVKPANLTGTWNVDDKSIVSYEDQKFVMKKTGVTTAKFTVNGQTNEICIKVVENAFYVGNQKCAIDSCVDVCYSIDTTTLLYEPSSVFPKTEAAPCIKFTPNAIVHFLTFFSKTYRVPTEENLGNMMELIILTKGNNFSNFTTGEYFLYDEDGCFGDYSLSGDEETDIMTSTKHNKINIEQNGLFYKITYTGVDENECKISLFYIGTMLKEKELAD